MRFLKVSQHLAGIAITMIVVAAVAAPLAAQTDSQLTRVVQLAQEGQGDSARALMARIMSGSSPADSNYAEVLYTSGLVAANVADMRRAYQRVSVEYASSAWADDALLRLGLLDYADGNPSGTLKDVERIRSDYPASPLMSVASYWGAKSAFDLKRTADACRWVDEGLAGVGDNIELKNQLTFLQNRCGPGMIPPPDEAAKPDTSKPAAPATPTTAAPKTPAAPVKGGYSVQLGAVKTQAAADELLKSITAAGLTGRVVNEGGFLKVRAGPYPTRAAADAAAAKLKAATGKAPYVVTEK